MIVGRPGRALWWRAAEELLKLAERSAECPVAASASGLGAIAHQNIALALGLVARAGHYQANHATRQADVLLADGDAVRRSYV